MGLEWGRDDFLSQTMTGEWRCKRKAWQIKPLRMWVGLQRNDRMAGLQGRFHELSQVVGAFGRSMIPIKTRARWPQ
jgi:hypothetical protein